MVRIGSEGRFRLANAHAVQNFEYKLTPLRSFEPAMQSQPLFELAANAHGWIKRCHRLLKDHARTNAANATECVGRQGGEIGVAQSDPPVQPDDSGGQQAKHRARHHSLARS